MTRLTDNIKSTIKKSKVYLSVPLVLGVTIGANVKHLQNKTTKKKNETSEQEFTDVSSLPQSMNTVTLSAVEAGENSEIVPVFSDLSYQQRVERTSEDMELKYNEHVKKYIDRYTINSRQEVKNLLERCDDYFPMIDQIFEEAGIPKELKYLAVIESGLKPNARSHAGAVGLWQFMAPTAKECKLRVDNQSDERKDARKATIAAAIYLKKLHNQFGDWYVALAAYNYGQGNVNKAIKKAGGGDVDFWDIRPYLPKETREYVPKFIAAAYVMENHEQHNITPDKTVRYFADKDAKKVNRDRG